MIQFIPYMLRCLDEIVPAVGTISAIDKLLCPLLKIAPTDPVGDKPLNGLPEKL
jgi:hypothetical protein